MADYARGQLLRNLRERRHLSQEDAAHELGVSVKSLRSWEKGGKIRWPNAKRAAEFYDIDPERLVTREEADEDTPDLVALDGNRRKDDGDLAELREQMDRIEQNQLDLAATLDAISVQIEASGEQSETRHSEVLRALGRRGRQAG